MLFFLLWFKEVHVYEIAIRYPVSYTSIPLIYQTTTATVLRFEFKVNRLKSSRTVFKIKKRTFPKEISRFSVDKLKCLAQETHNCLRSITRHLHVKIFIGEMTNLMSKILKMIYYFSVILYALWAWGFSRLLNVILQQGMSWKVLLSPLVIAFFGRPVLQKSFDEPSSNTYCLSSNPLTRQQPKM